MQRELVSIAFRLGARAALRSRNGLTSKGADTRQVMRSFSQPSGSVHDLTCDEVILRNLLACRKISLRS